MWTRQSGFLATRRFAWPEAGGGLPCCSRLVKAHGHGAGRRNQQRKAVNLKLGFKIVAKQVQPIVLRLISELFALGRTFVSCAGFVLKVMDHLMNQNG